MRKFFYWLGVTAAIAIVAVIIAGGLLARRGFSLDAEAKAYVDQAVVAICGNWDQQQLIDRAAPELLAAMKTNSLAGVFERASRVGPLLKYEGANGQASMIVYNGNAKITANYVATAQFEKGEATIKFALVKDDGGWRISGFHVDAHPKTPDSAIQHI